MNADIAMTQPSVTWAPPQRSESQPPTGPLNRQFADQMTDVLLAIGRGADS